MPIDPYHYKFIDSTWQLTDAFPNHKSILRVDIRSLPYEDSSVDAIYASHVLEHIPRGDTRNAVKEWARVLKPGGWIRVAVPDINYAAQLLVDNPEDHDKIELAWAHIYNTQTDEALAYHYFGFNEFSLKKLFEEFFEITCFERELESHVYIMTIAVEGLKR